ncbi:hypothetical protein [Micromonospora sp. NPDC049497]|uniref:hypothetical protein n=1 Tax=Micromonospora sp. NPDC049497 TaxID=3364273 RepID=UPI00378B2992
MSFPVPTAPIAMGIQEFQELVDRVERYMAQVEKNVQRLFDNCNRAVLLLPGFLAEEIPPRLERLRDLTRRLFMEMIKVTANPGWPPAILSASDDWTSRVGGPVSGLAARLTPDQMRSDNKWEGAAADAYAEMLPTQKAAVEGIKQMTDVLGSSLTKIGWGIIALWAGLAIATAAFVAELVAEVGAAATVVGAPPAAGAAALSTAKVVALVGATITAFLTYVALTADSLSTMRQKLAGHEAYPGGAWPRSTTSDIEDGSLSDGDGTDWRMKL